MLYNEMMGCSGGKKKQKGRGGKRGEGREDQTRKTKTGGPQPDTNSEKGKKER